MTNHSDEQEAKSTCQNYYNEKGLEVGTETESEWVDAYLAGLQAERGRYKVSADSNKVVDEARRIHQKLYRLEPDSKSITLDDVEGIGAALNLLEVTLSDNEKLKLEINLQGA